MINQCMFFFSNNIIKQFQQKLLNFRYLINKKNSQAVNLRIYKITICIKDKLNYIKNNTKEMQQ